MRKRIIYLTLAATLGIFAGLAIPRGTVWEYDLLKLERPADLKAVEEMGESGWEVAGAFRHWNGEQYMLLKRKR